MKLSRLIKTVFMVDFVTGLMIANKEVFKSNPDLIISIFDYKTITFFD